MPERSVAEKGGEKEEKEVQYVVRTRSTRIHYLPLISDNRVRPLPFLLFLSQTIGLLSVDKSTAKLHEALRLQLVYSKFVDGVN